MKTLLLIVACAVGIALGLLIAAALLWWAYCWLIDRFLNATPRPRSFYDWR